MYVLNYRNRWEDIPFKILLMLIKLFRKCIYIVPEGVFYKMIFSFRPTKQCDHNKKSISH